MTADYTLCRVLEPITIAAWGACHSAVLTWKAHCVRTKRKRWNFAELPSVLTRLLGNDSKVSGVNTTYLYGVQRLRGSEAWINYFVILKQ
ncbi:hypothetical protein K439DRAFT_1632846 [Ramaria rubella]|nr:hypothetical protein K439DRAFT_1632846 [Ramaria rubella]